jgi:betaine-aldehyde dehydrogenase
MRKYDLFIDGKWQNAQSDERIEIKGPTSDTTISSIPNASIADINAAVDAARGAFEGGWATESQQRRSQILRNMARLIQERAAELAAIEVSETGRPIAEIQTVDIPETADCLDYFAGAARLLKGETIPLSGPYFDYTLVEPLGVVAQIIPWNFPLNIAVWKVAPALATGNCIVLKPSELAPSTAMELAQIAMKAGLPPGVLNIVTGYGASVGEPLVIHPDVEMVAFTGSVATGRHIAELAGRSGKRVTLELGGKSAQLLFSDCDVDAAVSGVLEGAFFAQGESCCAGSRVLVHRSVCAEFLERLQKQVSHLRVGLPTAQETQIGCLISPQHLKRVMSYIEVAHKEGAEILSGGTTPKGAQFFGKPYLEPTIIFDPPLDSPLVQEEIFGPVLVVNAFDEDEEAIYLANATQFDLAAGIWTRDISRAHKVARRLRAGSVWINTYNRVYNDVPFGGLGRSGYGRDLGTQAMAQYTQIKNVCLSYEPGSDKWFV